MMAEVRDIKSKENIMVTVFLLTYNHAPYIEQTMNAILDQRVNFRMQLLIHDDASTDGTSDIIRRYANKYPNIITAIIQRENKYQKNQAVDIDAIPYMYGKYIALCEGDDYWPAVDKLEKQVEYLEKNPHIAGTGGVTRYYNDDGVECLEPMPKAQYLDRLITKKEFSSWRGFNVATNTLLFKSEIMKNDGFICAKKISPKVGDILVMTNMFEHGDIYIFDECFQNHRIQTRSDASNYNSLFDVREKFEDVIRVLEASVSCLKSQTLINWYVQNVSVYFWVFLRKHDIKTFFTVTKKVIPGYKKYTLVAIIRTFFTVIPQSIVRHLRMRFFLKEKTWETESGR